MPLVPKDWNVIVIGAWNRAILTPNGIATKLFGLPEGSPVEIEVPVDAIGPFRVGHEGLVVMVHPGQLTIEAQENNYSCLARGMAVAARAIEYLPETPFKAAGFNLRHQADFPKQQLLLLKNLAHCPLDDQIARHGTPILGKTLACTFKLDEGRARLFLDFDGESIKLNLNFEKASENKDDLLGWLRKPIMHVKRHAETIFRDVVGLSFD